MATSFLISITVAGPKDLEDGMISIRLPAQSEPAAFLISKSARRPARSGGN